MFKIVMNIKDTTGLHRTGTFKDISVKGALILAVIEDINETDDNLDLFDQKLII